MTDTHSSKDSEDHTHHEKEKHHSGHHHHDHSSNQSSDDVLAQRKAQLLQLLNTNAYAKGFGIVSLIFFFFAFLAYLGGRIPTIPIYSTFFAPFGMKNLLYLAIALALAAYFSSKEKYTYAFSAILVWIGYLAWFIRTRNLPNLRDVTTNTWTLGPDLDPFLFLRWTKDIVELGSLPAHDPMRYVPIGFNTGGELIFHSYLMAWFHKLAFSIGWTESVTHSAVLYPAAMFVLTAIAFFFFVREAFKKNQGEMKANIIGALSAFFLVIMPSLLPRTVAGIPEKESSGFFFLFAAFYFFLASWNASATTKRYVFAVFAGIATAAMAHVWGGYIFIFGVISISVFLAFLLGQITHEKRILYTVWIGVATIVIIFPTERYTLLSTVSSFILAPAYFLLVAIWAEYVLFTTSLSTYAKKYESRLISRPVIGLVVSGILGALASTLIFGPGFILSQAQRLISDLVTPVTTRLGVTVAENRQPFFNEWAGSFGPTVSGFPLVFWMFFLGSIYLFYHMVIHLKVRERIAMTLAYTYFLIALIFSRYASGSTFNGTNSASVLLYFSGFMVLLFVFGKYYYYHHKGKHIGKLEDIDYNLIVLFSLFFIGIVGARAAVRFIMVMSIPASILMAYLPVDIFSRANKVRDDLYRLIVWGIVAILILACVFTATVYYQNTVNTARSYAPSSYTQQWQHAMSWVRDNTSENAVFAHWWDYGYWVQSIGERATVLDGGNSVAYWNHLMGRHALTGTDEELMLEFLYAHNTTHFLIDPTDIGKYGAYASIGSDVDYDRESFIASFGRSAEQTQRTPRNTTLYFYSGGIGLDEDILVEINGSEIFIPRSGGSGLAGVAVEMDDQQRIVSNPIGVYVKNNGEQFQIPLKYGFRKQLFEFDEGLDAGIFIYPSMNNQGNIDQVGSMIYLSPRTIHSRVARYYLFGQESEYFQLAHSEDSTIVKEIKRQTGIDEDFIQFGGLQGPIKIWEVSYPEDITFNPEFVSTDYPTELRFA